MEEENCLELFVVLSDSTCSPCASSEIIFEQLPVFVGGKVMGYAER